MRAIAIEVDLPRGRALAGMAEDVREGLSCPFKELPPKYFYDERGSELFERITELPEYYPTRCEREILAARAAEIVAAADAAHADRARLGRRRQEPRPARRHARRRDARDLRARRHLRGDHPPGRRRARRRVPGARASHGIVCDYETHLERIPRPEGALFAFLGGTIGNFRPAPRRSFLARIATLMYPGDRFLLGTDLVKDAATVEAAYNDSAGRDGRVQQERPRTCSTASSTPTSTSTASSTSPSGTPRTSGSTSACAPSASSSSTSARSTCAPTSPATRRCGPRSRRSSPASGSRRATPTPGSS